MHIINYNSLSVVKHLKDSCHVQSFIIIIFLFTNHRIILTEI